MKRTLWYIWDTYISTVLAAMGTLGVLSLILAQGVRLEFFSTYYQMMPMMLLIFAAIYGFNLTTLFRNVALSFNCRRTDFFWAGQIAFAITAVGGAAIMWVVGVLPGLLGMEYAFQEEVSFLSGAPSYTHPAMLLFMLAVTLLLQPICAALGGLYGKSKVWSTVLLIVIMLFCAVGTVVMLFIGDGTIPFASTGLKIAGGVILGVMAVLCAAGEAYLYRSNAQAVVQ